MQVFCAGGKQRVRGGVGAGAGAALTTRVGRQKTPQRYLQEVKDSIPGSQRSVLAWRWTHVQT